MRLDGRGQKSFCGQRCSGPPRRRESAQTGSDLGYRRTDRKVRAVGERSLPLTVLAGEA
jgi:hypothetical protein